MARLTCKFFLSLGAVLYVIALAVGLIGTFGWFGQERDPVAWVFVIVLGQPWTVWVGNVAEPLRPWLAALAPILNLGILALLCRVLPARRPALNQRPENTQ